MGVEKQTGVLSVKYFISDIHFNHKKILDFCPERIESLGLDKDLVARTKKAFENYNATKKLKCPVLKKVYEDLIKELMDQMNDAIIEKINSRVQKRDTLIIGGDFAFGNVADAKKLLHRINGRKELCLGNHDRDALVMLNMGFSKVFENDYVKLNPGDHKKHVKVLMSHFPYFPTGLDRIKTWILVKLGIWEDFDKRYPYKRIMNTGEVLLCGHTHSKEIILGKKMIHIGCEALACTPISELEILEIIKEQGWDK